MAKYLSTKTYGTDRGLSCCFRQWRSRHSHCSLLHGYSIGIKLIFESETLDDRNWVMDFGGLKAFKEWADYMFDHTLVVAKDDPMLDFFEHMNEIVDVESENHLSKIPNERGALCDLRVVDGVGCELFSKLAYTAMNEILTAYQEGKGWTHPDGRVFQARYNVGSGVKLKSAEVFEHAGNSAIYEGL
jgi:6-pyruvoyltetrahydropterin/6-carboxytetrahydropterin synthase